MVFACGEPEREAGYGMDCVEEVSPSEYKIELKSLGFTSSYPLSKNYDNLSFFMEINVTPFKVCCNYSYVITELKEKTT